MGNLVEVVVAKLAGHKEKASLEDVHPAGHGHRVEILELDLRHHVLVSLQRDLEDVALLRLNEEEEHGLGLVGGAAHKDHPALRVVEIVAATRNWAADVRLVAEILVGDVVLGADEHAGGAVVSTGNRNQEVGMFIQGLGILPEIYIYMGNNFLE